MARLIDAHNLAVLIGEALFQANAIITELEVANNAIPSVTDPAVLRANYRALSQIFDDLVRIADTADLISTSLTRTPEIP